MYTHVYNVPAYRYGFNNVLTVYTHHAHDGTMWLHTCVFWKSHSRSVPRLSMYDCNLLHVYVLSF